MHNALTHLLLPLTYVIYDIFVERQHCWQESSTNRCLRRWVWNNSHSFI